MAYRLDDKEFGKPNEETLKGLAEVPKEDRVKFQCKECGKFYHPSRFSDYRKCPYCGAEWHRE